jgi:hypothetical protein
MPNIHNQEFIYITEHTKFQDIQDITQIEFQAVGRIFMNSQLQAPEASNAAVNVNSVPCTPLVGVDANLASNPEEPNIFSPSIFWRTHSNYASNTWVLIVFIFVEFLSSCQRVEYKTYEASSKCTLYSTLHDGGGKKEVGVVRYFTCFYRFLPKKIMKKKQVQCLQR